MESKHKFCSQSLKLRKFDSKRFKHFQNTENYSGFGKILGTLNKFNKYLYTNTPHRWHCRNESRNGSDSAGGRHLTTNFGLKPVCCRPETPQTLAKRKRAVLKSMFACQKYNGNKIFQTQSFERPYLLEN